MPLTLRVISYKGLPPATELSATFDHQGGAIGRSPDNQFVLLDPDKFISRKHGIISYENGTYFFADTSTAGTFLANKNLLLQHDRLALSQGDVLKIGDYELQVDLSGAPPAFEFGFPEPENLPSGEPARDPFSFDQPLPEITPPPLESAFPSTGEPPGPSFIDQPDVSSLHEPMIFPDVAPAPSRSESDIFPEFNPEELLRDFGGPDAARPAKMEEAPEFPDEFFQGLGEILQPKEQAAKSPQAEASPQGNEFPEIKAATLTPTPSTVGTTEQAADREHPVIDESPSVEAARGPSEPASSASLPHLPETGDRSGKPGPDPQAMVRPVGGTDPSGEELFRLFLEGAGLTEAGWLKREDLPEAMKTVGALFRDLVDGMMAVLRARSELKSQLRVSVTTLRPLNNNPLKFTVNVEDALRVLLSRDHPGFIDPLEAVREGYADLMNHQLAMAAGIQASLAALLKRFDPQQFERQFEEGIVFQRKGKCWDAYSKAYPEIVNEALENFFGEEFAEVYERQMQVLRASKKQP